jgi:uncharacterized protein (UPF0248 family)
MSKKNPLVDLFERIAWSMPTEQRDGISILITHRGARNDEKVLAMQDIIGFDHGYLRLKKQDNEQGFDYDDEISIPLHRVLKVVAADGNVLYEKGMTHKEK